MAGAGQVVWANLFLLGHSLFLARQLQIFIVTYLYKTTFLIYQKGKGLVAQGFDGTKVTFDRTLSVDRLLFQALVWYSTFRAKVSCIMSVDSIKLWLLI